ncbi:Hypothetical predicted protein [Paramuricea clavata]|uniref:Uncharacterized protein n=1 Tax=Paramuricea clavata TaxID=317549 RepID=A0A7D9ESW7_PARCT|nr:Hypothetical predicted protein [Paramuricea clavata]
MRVRSCSANLIYDDAVLQFSRRRRFSTKIRTKMEKNTISAKELEEKEGSKSGVCFIMKWTNEHDVEFCKEVITSKLFETKKRSAERAQVEQRSVRDRLKKLIKQFRKKENDERRASGISPELTELDTLLEEISEKEEASETLAADMGEREKRRLEEDHMAGQEMRKRAMETLSETKKRNTKIDQDSPKRKVRKGGNTALAFLAEKAEKETKLKEESNRLERERQEMEKEKTDNFMQQQNDMLTDILEMQRQQNNQVQASQMVLMQQQQQQGQALIALLSKIVDKEN